MDLSRSGLLVRTSFALRIGDEVSVIPVGAAGELLFEARATVVRRVEDPDRAGRLFFGLDFIELGSADELALQRLISAMPPTESGIHEMPDDAFATAEAGAPRDPNPPRARIRSRVDPTRGPKPVPPSPLG